MLHRDISKSVKAKPTIYCSSLASPFSRFCMAINFVLDNMVVLVFSHLKYHVFAKRKIYADVNGLQRGLAQIRQQGELECSIP